MGLSEDQRAQALAIIETWKNDDLTGDEEHECAVAAIRLLGELTDGGVW